MSTDCGAGINALGVSPDEAHLAVGGRDILKVFSIAPDGRLKESRNLRIKQKKGLDLATSDLQWHPLLSHTLATGSTNGVVSTWDVSRGKLQSCQDQSFRHARSVNRVAWHPSQHAWLLTASQDGTVRIFDARCGPGSGGAGGDQAAATFVAYTYRPETNAALGSLSVPEGASGGIQFCPGADAVRDAQFDPFHPLCFAAALEDGSVQLFDVRNARGCFNRFTAHAGLVTCCEFHPDVPDLLATGGRDRLVRIWRTGSGSREFCAVLQRRVAAVGSARPKIAGQMLAAVDESGGPLTDSADDRGELLPIASIQTIASVSKLGWRSTMRQRTRHAVAAPDLTAPPPFDDDSDYGGGRCVDAPQVPPREGGGLTALHFQLVTCSALLDSNAYVWDVRHTFLPCAVFGGHRDVVSGCTWLRSRHVAQDVTAGAGASEPAGALPPAIPPAIEAATAAASAVRAVPWLLTAGKDGRVVLHAPDAALRPHMGLRTAAVSFSGSELAWCHQPFRREAFWDNSPAALFSPVQQPAPAAAERRRSNARLVRRRGEGEGAAAGLMLQSSSLLQQPAAAGLLGAAGTVLGALRGGPRPVSPLLLEQPRTAAAAVPPSPSLSVFSSIAGSLPRHGGRRRAGSKHSLSSTSGSVGVGGGRAPCAPPLPDSRNCAVHVMQSDPQRLYGSASGGPGASASAASALERSLAQARDAALVAFDPAAHTLAVLALTYVAEGAAPHLLCAHNARVAAWLGLHDTAQVWRVFAVLFGPASPEAVAAAAALPPASALFAAKLHRDAAAAAAAEAAAAVAAASEAAQRQPRSSSEAAQVMPTAAVPALVPAVAGPSAKLQPPPGPVAATGAGGSGAVATTAPPQATSSSAPLLQVPASVRVMLQVAVQQQLAEHAAPGYICGLLETLALVNPEGAALCALMDDEASFAALWGDDDDDGGAAVAADDWDRQGEDLPRRVRGRAGRMSRGGEGAASLDDASVWAAATADSDSTITLPEAAAAEVAASVPVVTAAGSVPTAPQSEVAKESFATEAAAAAVAAGAAPRKEGEDAPSVAAASSVQQQAPLPHDRPESSPDVLPPPPPRAALVLPPVSLATAAASDWHALRLAVARDVLSHYADRGDVQLCVTLSRALGAEVEALVPRRRLQGWLVSYIELLHRLQLWSPASTVMARCSDEGIRRMNQAYTQLAPACGVCGADTQPAVPDAIVRGAAADAPGGGAFPVPEQERWRAEVAAAHAAAAAAAGASGGGGTAVAAAATAAAAEAAASAPLSLRVARAGSDLSSEGSMGCGSDSAAPAGGDELLRGGRERGADASSSSAPQPPPAAAAAPSLFATEIAAGGCASSVQALRVGVKDLRDPARPPPAQALLEPVPVGADGLPPFLCATLQPGATALQAAAPRACADCRAPVSTCAVCLQPVRGVYAWCQGCGHGGHLEHMLEWFAACSSLCPAGCMHVCDLQQLQPPNS